MEGQDNVPGSVRLGPNDTYGKLEIPLDGDVIESLIPRNQRIDDVINLIGLKKYGEIVNRYFDISYDGSVTDASYSGMRAQAVDALKALVGTNTGARLLVALAHKGVSAGVMITNSSPSEAQVGSNRIEINVSNGVRDFENHFRRSDGSTVPTNLAVIIGHELGHAVLGYNDVYFDINTIIRLNATGHVKVSPGQLGTFLDKGDNVKYVENPLRRELGLPTRPSYVSDSYLRKHLPELFRK